MTLVYHSSSSRLGQGQYILRTQIILTSIHFALGGVELIVEAILSTLARIYTSHLVRSKHHLSLL